MTRVALLILVILNVVALGISPVSAGQVGELNSFTGGTPAIAEDVNENFEEIQTAVNDNDLRISDNGQNTTTNTTAIANNTSNINQNTADIQNKGLIDVTVLTVSCAGNVSFPQNAFVRLSDIGTFTKVLSGSIIEVQFNGTVYASSMNGSGAVYELRVDDQPSSEGWARIALKQDNMGNETTGTMTGIFSGLSTGSHTVSIWVIGANGPGTGAYVDPGCWDSTHVIVKELN
jgi:hypothetical protein